MADADFAFLVSIYFFSALFAAAFAALVFVYFIWPARQFRKLEEGQARLLCGYDKLIGRCDKLIGGYDKLIGRCDKLAAGYDKLTCRCDRLINGYGKFDSDLQEIKALLWKKFNK